MTTIKIVKPKKTYSLEKEITPYNYKEQIYSLIREYFSEDGLDKLFGGAGAKVFINGTHISPDETPKENIISKIEIRLYKIEHEFHPQYSDTRIIDGDIIGEWTRKYKDF